MRGEPERGARRHKPPPRLRQSPPPANLAGAGSTLANADGKPDSANISEFRAARSERAPQQANPHTRARPRKPTTHAQACAHAHAHKHMQACTHANRYFSSSVLLCFASQLQVPLFLDIPSPAVLDHRRMQRALGKPPRENELLYEPATQPQVLAELLDVGGISVELAPKWSSSYAANSHLRLWGEPACVTSPRWPCPRPRRHGGCAPRWTAPPPRRRKARPDDPRQPALSLWSSMLTLFRRPAWPKKAAWHAAACGLRTARNAPWRARASAGPKGSGKSASGRSRLASASGNAGTSGGCRKRRLGTLSPTHSGRCARRPHRRLRSRRFGLIGRCQTLQA